MDLLSHSHLAKLSRGVNELASSGAGAWARSMLEKQGWVEGQGLGKAGDGATTHVRVAKKADTAALGYTPTAAADAEAAWWVGACKPDPTRVIGGAAAVTLSDADDDTDSDESEGAAAARKARRRAAKKRARAEGAGLTAAAASPTAAAAVAFPGAPEGGDVQEFYAALFAATGGARLGMRARRDQPGKEARVEARARGGEGGALLLAEAQVKEAEAAPHPSCEKSGSKRERREAAAAAEAAATEAAVEAAVGDEGKEARRRKRKAEKAAAAAATAAADEAEGGAEGEGGVGEDVPAPRRKKSKKRDEGA